jgi:flagellar assembly factor FliW
LNNAAFIEHTKSDVCDQNQTLVHMDEGLIGFSRYRAFVLLENSDILPFRLLESVDTPKLTFAVIEPTILRPGYLDLVPVREWETIGLTDAAKRLAFVIAPIGETAKESTANLQSPILVNYETMTARQVILTDSGLSARHPLG